MERLRPESGISEVLSMHYHHHYVTRDKACTSLYLTIALVGDIKFLSSKPYSLHIFAHLRRTEQQSESVYAVVVQQLAGEL